MRQAHCGRGRNNARPYVKWQVALDARPVRLGARGDAHVVNFVLHSAHRVLCVARTWTSMRTRTLRRLWLWLWLQAWTRMWQRGPVQPPGRAHRILLIDDPENIMKLNMELIRWQRTRRERGGRHGVSRTVGLAAPQQAPPLGRQMRVEAMCPLVLAVARRRTYTVAASAMQCFTAPVTTSPTPIPPNTLTPVAPKLLQPLVNLTRCTPRGA